MSASCKERATAAGLRPLVRTCLAAAGLVGLIAGVLAAAWGMLVWREWREQRHWWVDDLVPVDLDGEPGMEVVVVYGAPDEHATSVLEAVKIETGEVLWSGRTPNEGGIGYRGNPSHAVGAGRFVLLRGTDESGEPGARRRVSMHRSADGELLWDTVPPAGLRWGEPVRAWFDDERLVMRMDGPGSYEGTIIAYDADDGVLLWDRVVPHGPAELLEIDGAKALDFGGRIVLLEVETGPAQTIERSEGLGWLSDGRYCASYWCSSEPARLGLGTVDGTSGDLLPIERNGRPLWLPDEDVLYGIEGIHDDSALLVDTGTYSSWLEAMPLLDQARAWRVEYEEGLGQTRMWWAGSHALVLLETPHWGGEPVPPVRKLAALDLRTGQFVWEGAEVDGSVSIEEVHEYGEMLVMRVEYRTVSGDRSEAWLTFDGTTGRFRRALGIDLVRTERDGGLQDNAVHIWLFADGVLFGYEHNKNNIYPDTVIAVDVDDWTGHAHGPKEVRIRDRWGVVEPLLGGITTPGRE